jgi:DNA-binding IclR family transcriptional regulator
VATRTGTQAIERAAELLVRVVDSESPPTVGDLAAQSGLPKSTTSRLVAALERQGLVQRDAARGGVLAGPALVRYAHRERRVPDLLELAAPGLDRLAALSGETVNLGVATPEAVEQLDQRDSRHYLGSTNWVGRRVPLHASALGKVFLAYEVVALPPGPLERLAPRTIADRRTLERELATVRARGLATAVDELEPGLWAIAAPVFDAAGTAVAALSVSGPTVRLHDGVLDELGRALRQEATTLSIRLGHDNTTRGAA